MIPFLTGIYARQAYDTQNPPKKRPESTKDKKKNKLDFKKWRKVCDLITTSYIETYPKL